LLLISQQKWLIIMVIFKLLSIIILNLTGEEVAFYFSWMSFYTNCALVPAVVGMVMYYLRSSEATVDTDPYLPFFSLFMCIWAVLFIVVRGK